MRYQKAFCILLGLFLLTGCHKENADESVMETDTSYEEVTANVGDVTTFDDVTLTVLSAEDPGIEMSDDKKAMFFKVQIQNDTQAPLKVSYLNNFTLTLNGTYYEAYECCTMPVMRKLYDFYGENALSAELAAGETCMGYVACEVDEKYNLIELHFTPKTEDLGSMITVTLTDDDVISVKK